ncbi:MAG: SRPBCC domain-containing protein [Calditrichaeota bacterium]|nr:MAG: SRPBCC domain-containing protein [Calditrichota bacterium]
MTEKYYSREITVSSSPATVYKALTAEFEKWWTTTNNEISAVGDLITFQFPPTYWTMRALKLVPGKYVELQCVEANHEHSGLPESIRDEWKDTKLKWEIRKTGKKTKIIFMHAGLSPSLDCYKICEAGWDYFFVNSLKKYLDEGTGMPFDPMEQRT